MHNSAKRSIEGCAERGTSELWTRLSSKLLRKDYYKGIGSDKARDYASETSSLAISSEGTWLYELFVWSLMESRILIMQVERNLQDAMGVARNVCFDPRLVPGGGAVEMAVSHALSERADNVQVESIFLG